MRTFLGGGGPLLHIRIHVGLPNLPINRQWDEMEKKILSSVDKCLEDFQWDSFQ